MQRSQDMSKIHYYNIILEKVGDQPLKTTKILCQVLGLGLAAAKGMVNKAPTTVATGMDRDKALALRDELEAIVSIPRYGNENGNFYNHEKSYRAEESNGEKVSFISDNRNYAF